MNKSRASTAVLSGVLIAAGAAIVGCPKPMRGPEPMEPVVTGQGGSFVAGVFRDFMNIGRVRVVAAGKKPEMFVGHFDGRGRASWLRSFPTIAEGRAIAFVPERDQITILGVIDESVSVDGKELSTGSTPDRPQKNILFLAVFNREGRSLAGPQLVAKANTIATPDVERVVEGLKVSVRTSGGIEVPGPEIPGDGNDLELLLDAKGAVKSGQRVKERAPLLPERRPAGMKKAMFHPDDAQSGWMLAMQTDSTCDYCRATSDVWLDGDCSTCRTHVCGSDSYCCGTAWDWICKASAESRCKSLPGTITHKCVCAHGTCSTGISMQPFCTSTVSGRASCAKAVDDHDDYCYKTTWDSDCNSESPTYCPSPGCF